MQRHKLLAIAGRHVLLSSTNPSLLPIVKQKGQKKTPNFFRGYTNLKKDPLFKTSKRHTKI